MCRKMGLFCVLANSTAASSSSCHATGESACDFTNGLLLALARFSSGAGSAGAVMPPAGLLPSSGLNSCLPAMEDCNSDAPIAVELGKVPHEKRGGNR